ncbi:MAG: ROK family transcriptional regulator [Chloroflexota bacterium]
MMSHTALLGNNIIKVKAHNLQIILRILLQHEPVSRVQLAELTGLSSTTITNLIAELQDQDIVVEDGNQVRGQNGMGRPRRMLRLQPTARYAVGIHIGIGRIRVAVTDLFGQVLQSLTLDTDVTSPPTVVLDRVAIAVQKILNQAAIDRTKLIGLGVGASGLVDVQAGINILAPNLGWHNFPIRDHLGQMLDLPVLVDNNVRAMALAESMFGLGRSADTLAFVYARVGVGAGFVIDGSLYRGKRAGAGEIGHTVIVPTGGIPCQCGNTGCLETLISEPEIVRQAQIFARREPESVLATQMEQHGSLTAEAIFEAARLGDNKARSLVEERAHYMGIALANLVNTLNPDMIIMGGLFASGQDLLLPPIISTVQQRPR